MTIFHRDNVVDFLELDMVDFDVVLWMDWLYYCYASMVAVPEKSLSIFQIN